MKVKNIVPEYINKEDRKKEVQKTYNVIQKKLSNKKNRGVA